MVSLDSSPADDIGHTILVIMFILFILIVLAMYLSWVIPERQKYLKYVRSLNESVGKARKKGHSDAKIRKALQKQGHKERHIKKALK